MIAHTSPNTALETISQNVLGTLPCNTRFGSQHSTHRHRQD